MASFKAQYCIFDQLLAKVCCSPARKLAGDFFVESLSEMVLGSLDVLDQFFFTLWALAC